MHFSPPWNWRYPANTSLSVGSDFFLSKTRSLSGLLENCSGWNLLLMIRMTFSKYLSLFGCAIINWRVWLRRLKTVNVYGISCFRELNPSMPNIWNWIRNIGYKAIMTWLKGSVMHCIIFFPYLWLLFLAISDILNPVYDPHPAVLASWHIPDI